MKYQNLFSGEKMRNISKRLLKTLPRVLSVNERETKKPEERRCRDGEIGLC